MKSAIVYFSSTGNTEAMAKAIAETAAGADLIEVSSISADEVLAYDAVAFGCSAMGDEELDDADMEPMIEALEEKGMSGKKVALFGSYDWGDGEWMRKWYDRMQKAGAEMIQSEGLIANLEPDDDAIAACKELGAQLV